MTKETINEVERILWCLLTRAFTSCSESFSLPNKFECTDEFAKCDALFDAYPFISRAKGPHRLELIPKFQSFIARKKLLEFSVEYCCVVGFASGGKIGDQVSLHFGYPRSFIRIMGVIV